MRGPLGDAAPYGFSQKAPNQFSGVSLGPDPEEGPAGYGEELKTDVKADREELEGPACVRVCVFDQTKTKGNFKTLHV